MTPDELNALRQRFGEDITAWPAPYRQEARLVMLDPRAADADAELDRLIRAGIDPSDERDTARAVFARIDRRTPGDVLRPRAATALASALVLVLTMAGIGGYALAGGSADRDEDMLLAIALGEPPAEFSIMAGGER